jgi:beta-galactosidase
MKAYYDDVPFVHLLPHWNHTVGEKVQVCVYSNCQRVKVYLNEKLIDEKTVERGRAEFEVVFAPGVLRAEGFADNDVFEDKVITSGNICRV